MASATRKPLTEKVAVKQIEYADEPRKILRSLTDCPLMKRASASKMIALTNAATSVGYRLSRNALRAARA